MSREDHELVVSKLARDVRKDGARGWALVGGIPHLNLLAGDRLEPGDDLPCTADFWSLTMFPVEATFWRRSAESVTYRRNPLYCAAIGVSVEILLVDALHCLYLGILRKFSAELIWEIVLSGTYVKFGTQDEKVFGTIRMFETEMFGCYSRYRREHRDKQQLSELQVLTPPMIGTKKRPTIKAKGDETRGFFLFLLDVISRKSAAVNNGPLWLLCAEAYEYLQTCLRSFPLVLNIEQVQELWGS